MLARQENRAGPLETALARSRAEDAREAREEAAYAPDPDERAANLIAGGYSPGRLYELAQRLGDTTAELEAERAKLEKAARRAEIAGREHAAGRVDVFRMLAMMDGDEGDEGRVAHAGTPRGVPARADRRDPEHDQPAAAAGARPGGGGQPPRACGAR